MQKLRGLLCSAIIFMSMYIFSRSPMYADYSHWSEERLARGRMENVDVGTEAVPLRLLPTPDEIKAVFKHNDADSAPPDEEAAENIPVANGTILPTTIEGGLKIKNQTSYQTDIGKLLKNGTDITLAADKMQILIIHTHSSEAYTQSGADLYDPSDINRTEDTKYNIVRVGDELEQIFRAAGLNVIHDRNIYDYPSYTGSYNRSGQAIENYLTEYPDIQIVLDIHRDSLGEKGIIYKTVAEENGKCASQVMLLVGTDESGLEHDNWQSNLALAMYLQNAVSGAHPTLMRPVMLVPQRYNQHLTSGSLIVEVGSDGNTLQEALYAVRLFGEAAAPALLALVK